MKTDDLIRALAADRPTPSMPVGRALLIALVPGAAIAAALFAVEIGLRPQLATLIGEPRLTFKIALSALLAVAAAPVVVRLARPGADPRAAAAGLILIPIALVASVVVELAVMPASTWGTRLIGVNATFCLRTIPLLAAAPLAAALLALRHGAPTRPGLAGAAAGLLAGAIGATLYALHCPDDSPLFVATWYPLAIAIVTAAGATAGRWLLRW